MYQPANTLSMNQYTNAEWSDLPSCLLKPGQFSAQFSDVSCELPSQGQVPHPVGSHLGNALNIIDNISRVVSTPGVRSQHVHRYYPIYLANFLVKVHAGKESVQVVHNLILVKAGLNPLG